MSCFTETECKDDIPANHLDTGNVRFRKCPRSPGGTCTVDQENACHSNCTERLITFKCINGNWDLFKLGTCKGEC